MLEVWKLGSIVCETSGEPLEEVDCFKYLGSKWQWMEFVKGM